jgi:hypothetical protein
MDAWRKLDERLVYDRFRRVVSRRFRLPDGSVTDTDAAYRALDFLGVL